MRRRGGGEKEMACVTEVVLGKGSLAMWVVGSVVREGEVKETDHSKLNPFHYLVVHDRQ